MSPFPDDLDDLSGVAIGLNDRIVETVGHGEFRMSDLLKDIDWSIALPAGLAGTIFLGGMLMMFTGIWTARDR